MGVLEQVTRMKNQGIPDDEIVNNLSQQGVSPREINDAMNQAQIKNAVTDMDTGEMQPSVVIGGEEDLVVPSPQTQATYKPKTKEAEPQIEEEYIAQPETYSPPEQVYQPAQQYAEYETLPSAASTDTIIEIAEQIFSEKIKKVQKQADTLTEISTLLQTKLENLSDRLKRIETIIDKLQIAILEKVGSYGQNLDSIKKEMSMMQDSFSKMVSPIMEKSKEKKSLDDVFQAENQSQEVLQKRTKKSKSSV